MVSLVILSVCRGEGTDMTGGGNGGGGGGGACAVCKHQRRKCEPNCELAAYFPAHRMNDFRALHLVFGVANLTKLIIKANATDAARRRAAETLTWEARWRERDPAEGCYREVACLRRDNALLRADNAALRRQLADHHHLLLCWSSTTNNMAAGGGNGQLVAVRPPPPSHAPAPPPAAAAMRDHPSISSRDNKSSNPRC
ncbi:LOB domain-containing protein 15 [Setaria italica]|nr:LOB domain-containing protein 15 [Setaria italica]